MASQPRQPTNRPIQDRPVDEAPYGILIEEDMIDDSTGIIPTRGLGVPLSLKDRFVRRLSKMLGAEANIREVPNGNAMDIFLTRGKQSPWPSVTLDDGLRKFVRDLEDALTCVARETTGMFCSSQLVLYLTNISRFTVFCRKRRPLGRHPRLQLQQDGPSNTQSTKHLRREPKHLRRARNKTVRYQRPRRSQLAVRIL
jgi:hypothetical protein